MIGAMFSVAFLEILTGRVWYPDLAFFLVKVGAGMFIGVRLHRRDLLALRRLALAVLVLIIWMLLFNILVAYSVTALTRVDLLTALLSTSPAGLTEMTILASENGAQPAVVTAMHVVRIMVVLSIFPTLARSFSGLYHRVRHDEPGESGETSQQAKPDRPRTCLLLTAAAGLAGGYLGQLSAIPGGVMIGSMLATIVLGVGCGRAWLPADKRWMIQLLGGLTIGSGFTMGSLLQLTTVLPAVAIMIAGNLLMWISLGPLLMKFGRLDIETALLAACPGGVSDMSLVALDMHGEPGQVALLQIMRLILTLTFFPAIYAWLGAG